MFYDTDKPSEAQTPEAFRKRTYQMWQTLEKRLYFNANGCNIARRRSVDNDRAMTGGRRKQELQGTKDKVETMQNELSIVKNWCYWLEKTVSAVVSRNDKVDIAMNKCIAICDKQL